MSQAADIMRAARQSAEDEQAALRRRYAAAIERTATGAAPLPGDGATIQAMIAAERLSEHDIDNDIRSIRRIRQRENELAAVEAEAAAACVRSEREIREEIERLDPELAAKMEDILAPKRALLAELDRGQDLRRRLREAQTNLSACRNPRLMV